MHVFTEIPVNLKKSVQSGNLIPFVGAGVSRNVKFRGMQDEEKHFPLWHDLVRTGAEVLRPIKNLEAEAIIAQLRTDQPDLLALATKLREQMGPSSWARCLRDQLNPPFARINQESLQIARLIWGLQSSLIVTTNYDKVLQWACPQPQDMERIITDEPFHLSKIHSEQHASPLVWHIHGHIECPDAMVLTSSDYQTLYDSQEERSERVRTTLGQLFLTKSLLFVGFGMQDPKINDLMTHFSSVFKQYGMDHFMLVRQQDVPATQTLLHTAGLENIHIVTFEAFGAPLERLLEDMNQYATGARTARQPENPPHQRATPQADAPPAGISYGDSVEEIFSTRARTLTIEALRKRPEWQLPTPIEDLTTECCLHAAAAMERLPKITGLGQAELHRLLDRSSGATVFQTLREHWPDSDALGAMPIDTVLDLGLEATVARIVGLDRENTHGVLTGAPTGTLTSSLFSHWPKRAPTPAANNNELSLNAQDADLGALRVKAAIRGNLAPRIAEITGLRIEHIERELLNTHGNTKLRALFSDAWPTDDEIGDMRVDTVLKLGLETTVAQISGWTVFRVRETLRDTEDSLTIRTALAGSWPDFLSADDPVPSLKDTTGESASLPQQRFGRTTAATARRQDEAMETIALITGLGLKGVKRRLANAHGKTRIERVFEAEWPSDDMLGEYTVAQIMSLGLVGTVADILGAGTDAIAHELRQVFGQRKLRSIYPEIWSKAADPETPTSFARSSEVADSDLGYLSVSDTRRLGIEHILAEITGLSHKAVEVVLAQTHGRTHLRKAFEQRWPSDNAIGDFTVAATLKLSLCGTISRITGVSVNAVRKRLDAVYGNNLVRTCFSGEWPE